MYQVVKEMIDKMGYEVCFALFLHLSILFFVSLSGMWALSNVNYEVGQTCKGYQESA